MHRLVVASTRRNAGKTSIIIGLARARNLTFRYLKPFGDRIYYRKKRLWDYDAALLANIFNLPEPPEDMSLGFDHVKIRFMFDEERLKAAFNAIFAGMGSDAPPVLVEAGATLAHGAYVHLDAMTLARELEAHLLLVVSGTEEEIMDDLCFLRRHLGGRPAEGLSVIINKLPDPQDFRDVHGAELEVLELPILGCLPYQAELTHFSVRVLAERLFARVIAGDEGLERTVERVFIGAATTDAVMQDHHFRQANKLVITSGDRTDMVLAALETESAGVVLTNGILPPHSVTAKATAQGVPLLLLPGDTYQVARQIDQMDPLFKADDHRKIEILAELARKYLDLDRLGLG